MKTCDAVKEQLCELLAERNLSVHALAIASSVHIPTVAIGGITYANMEELQGSGVSGFAFVSEIFAQSDIAASARRLLQRAKAIVK